MRIDCKIHPNKKKSLSVFRCLLLIETFLIGFLIKFSHVILRISNIGPFKSKDIMVLRCSTILIIKRDR